MGEVYLAQHPRLPRRDALNSFPRTGQPTRSTGPLQSGGRSRFDALAPTHRRCARPWRGRRPALDIYGLCRRPRRGPATGRSVSSRNTSQEVARIVTAVASALDYAHKQGLLHRDVKPANIMLTHLDDEGEQRILLTDLGIARNVNDISGLTKTNMTVGTVAYCAPRAIAG